MKESLSRVDKRIVFREIFTDEDSVRKNGGTPTAVTFSNGVGGFNGTTSYLDYKRSLNGTYSVRIKLSSITLAESKFFLDMRNDAGGDTGIVQNSSPSTSLVPSSGTTYVDGVATTTISANTKEIVVTGMSLIGSRIRLGARYSLTNLLTAGYELVEIYQGTLTANEVKTLYENKAYKELSLNKTQQLGSELIVNGDMSSSTGWTLGTGVTIANGKCTFVTGSQYPGASQSLAVTRYNRYRLTLTITDYTSGYLTITPGGSATSFNITGALGTFNYDFMFNGTVSTFYIRGDAGNFIGSIDNVSVKEILVDYTKEILNVDARNGVINNKFSENSYVNLITTPDFDTDSGWTKGTGWTISEGSAHATNLASDASMYQSILVIGKTYKAVYKISNISGQVQCKFGTGTIAATHNTNGEYISQGVCTGNVLFHFYGNAGLSCDIDYCYVYEVIPSITNTSVTVKKDGDGYAMDFNPVSKLNCGSYDSLIGDKTFIFWAKNKTSVSTYTAPRFIDNNKLLIYRGVTMPADLNMSSNGATYINLSASVLLNNVWQMIVITRTFNGISNAFINGSPSGTANQSSGTPVAGTSNITIGGIDASSDQVLTGRLSQVRIIDGILSAQEISQLYTNEKGYYNL